MGKNKRIINKVILIAMFSAACCVGTMVKIPLPSGMVHLGNAICLLAALLCGGIVGGLSGSIGMGLYDFVLSSSGPSTIVRTIIMKFIMGFVAGYLFRLLFNKKDRSTVFLFIFSFVFCGVCIWSTVLYTKGLGFAQENKQLSLFVPISSAAISALFLGCGIFSYKIPKIQRFVMFITAIAVITNIIGEFFLRIPLVMLIDSQGFDYAFNKSVLGIPSTLLTGLVSLVITTVCYLPLYKAVSHLDFFKATITVEE